MTYQLTLLTFSVLTVLNVLAIQKLSLDILKCIFYFSFLDCFITHYGFELAVLLHFCWHVSGFAICYLSLA